jgi:hypothetical protein
MGQDGFGDLVSDTHDGIEGGHGLLEDHGHAQPAQSLQLRWASCGQFAALEENGAG